MTFGSEFLLPVIKSVICVYDLVTLPVYQLVQQPCRARRKSRKKRAQKLEANNPTSPWVSNQPDLVGSHFIKECKTLPELFYKSVQHFKDRRCLGHRECFGVEDETQADGKTARKYNLGDYIWYSYAEVQLRVDHIREGLSEAGVRPGDHVVIFSETRIEWHLAAQALLQLQAVVVTLYSTLTDEGIVHGINECEASHVITSSNLLLKLKNLFDQIDRVEQFIVFGEPFEGGADSQDTRVGSIKLNSFRGLESNGASIFKSQNYARGNDESPRRIPNVRPDDTAVVMYTSGTTGTPKGVMITHKNLLQALKAAFVLSGCLERGQQTYMSYLPLAHIFALIADFLFVAYGVPIGYSSPATMSALAPGLKRGQRGDAALLKPTIIATVPLVLDRIRKGIMQDSELKGKLYTDMIDFVVEYKKFWTSKGFRTPIMDFVVCRRFSQLLGGQIKVIGCGGAPLSPKTREFVEAMMNVKILQGYGSTETLALTTMTHLSDLGSDTAGPPLQGVCVRLVDWDEGDYCVTDGPLPRGELVVGGDSVAAGYFKRPEETAQLFHCDEDGKRWFFTGDIVEIQANGNLKIIDRKKDLIKLQNGEYLSLSKVEAELKACEYVDNICVYGDSFKSYLIALVTPDRVSLKKLAHNRGKGGCSFEELCKDQEILAHVTEALIECAKTAGLPRNEIPIKYRLCHEEWLPDAGLVTTTMKIRRKSIQTFYQKEIIDTYATGNNAPQFRRYSQVFR